MVTSAPRLKRPFGKPSIRKCINEDFRVSHACPIAFPCEKKDTSNYCKITEEGRSSPRIHGYTGAISATSFSQLKFVSASSRPARPIALRILPEIELQLLRPVNRPYRRLFDVSEQLGFDQRLREGCAGRRDEWAGATRALSPSMRCTARSRSAAQKTHDLVSIQ
jgi:hypothetical protein